MRTEKQRAWMEISKDQLAQNYHAIRGLLAPECRFMGIIKSNGYGHGALQMARCLEELGADYLGVACLEEALELRDAGITCPILILGATMEEDMALLVQHNLTQTVFDADMAQKLSRIAEQVGAPLRVHIKVDTGMGRLGFLCDEETLDTAAAEIETLCQLPGLIYEGIFTHFADADGDEDFTVLQFGRFLNLLDRLEAQGLRFPIRHSANSAATLRYPFSHLDMVRPGLALYGYYLAEDMQPLCDLTPAMELKSRLASIRTLPAGMSLSYGRTAKLDEPRKIAVVSIGYGDGFYRAYSNEFSVSIHGKTAPIVGRVCMDMCMVDVTDIPEATVGDEVLIYARDIDSPQSLDAAARSAGTITHELLCSLSKRLPRVWDEAGTKRAAST